MWQAEQELEASDTFLRQQRAKNWFSAPSSLRIYSSVRFNPHAHACLE
jgi:hypothetical protein